MPYRKKRYTKKKKKDYKKRNPKYYTSQAITPSRQLGFPGTSRSIFRYVDLDNLDTTIGSVAITGYGANNPFDPYSSPGGHQPMGWDQMTAYYNHYVCIGSKITVTFSPKNTSASYGPSLCCGIFLSDDLTVPTTAASMIEQGLTKYKVMSRTMTSFRPQTVTHHYSTRKFFNVTDVKDNTARLGANTAASPTELAHFVVWCGSLDAGDDPPEISALIKIEYIVDFSEPKALPQS